MKKKLISSVLLLGCTALIVACSTPVDLSESAEHRSPDTSVSDSATNGSPAGMDAMSGSEYRCDADPAQTLLGQTVSSDIEARAKELSGSKTVRTLRPDNVITMEYNPQRINLRVDEQDAITSVGCG